MLEPLRTIKNWFTNTRTREECWDEINNNLLAWATRTNNNLKQLGLDLNGASYDFNNVGKSTQTTSIITRISELESQSAIVGTRNIGLDLSTQSKVKIVSADGTNLSSSNKGQIHFNSTTNAGQLITRDITSNLEVTLTGAHWGFDTDGDLTDFPLWVLFLDTGSSVVLGVAAQGGRQSLPTTDTETSAGAVTTINKVLISSAIASTLNITYLGWVKADFDDTGNAGGENFWTVQNSVGDINIGPIQTLFSGEVRA